MILSRDDIENIADGVIKDFRKVTGINTIFTTIDQLATDYLGLRVTFEKLSNDDSFCGVTAYDDTFFKVIVDGHERVIKIAKNQIILDSDFIEIGKVQERCGKRRFTLAHEVAHQILFQMQSDEEKAQLRKMYSTRKAHTIRELKSAEDWNEWQANALGASLLMPRASVTTFIATFEEAIDEKHSPLINDIGFYTDYIVDSFCEYFHVSKSSAVIRLQQLGYLTEDNTLRKAVSYV